MTHLQIEHRKERLVFMGAIVPVRCLGRFVPDVILIPVEVVVGLGIIGAIVTGPTQVFGKTANMVRQGDPGSHMVGTNGDRILSGNDSRATGSTHSMARKGVGVPHAFGRQFVKIGSCSPRVAVTPKVRANVFTADPQNIGAFSSAT